MHISIILVVAASAGLVAAQTDPAGQCIQTCFAKVGQENPNSPDIKRCHALADGLQQLLCLCRSTPLVDAFTTCAGETCPEFAEQVNGTAICQSSETGALDPSDRAAGPSDTASGVDAGPSNTAGGEGAGLCTNTASGAGASTTDSGAPAGGTQAPGGTDAANSARAQRVSILHLVVGGAAAVSLLV